jgi:hypothetical protein
MVWAMLCFFQLLVAYLLKARTAGLEKQPLSGNDYNIHARNNKEIAGNGA